MIHSLLPTLSIARRPTAHARLHIRRVTRNHIRMASDQPSVTRILETRLGLPLVADLTKAFRLSRSEV
jgi:hypothetical protein